MEIFLIIVGSKLKKKKKKIEANRKMIRRAEGLQSMKKKTGESQI